MFVVNLYLRIHTILLKHHYSSRLTNRVYAIKRYYLKSYLKFLFPILNSNPTKMSLNRLQVNRGIPINMENVNSQAESYTSKAFIINLKIATFKT